MCGWGWGALPYRDRGRGKDDKNLKGVRKRNEVNKEIEKERRKPRFAYALVFLYDLNDWALHN